ncbi:MAG: hypothetical protein H8E44_06185 [Planctomycetes bacterium]|nr:hypothetical protein [Planctomycetota bacterium]
MGILRNALLVVCAFAVLVLATCLRCEAQDLGWHPVPHEDQDMQAPDAGAWRPYRGAEVSKVEQPDTGRRVLRVSVMGNDFGGLMIQATPRGGFGKRVRATLRYRVVQGGPVTIHAGPNTWNQVAAVLTSRDWETAVVEVGLLSDFHLVLHVVQAAPGGVFEISNLQVAAYAPEQGVREGLGPVDVAVCANVPSNPSAVFRLRGSPVPTLTSEVASDAIFPEIRMTTAGDADANACRVGQLLGALPAGSDVTITCRCRVAPGKRGVLGLSLGNNTLARAETAAEQWTDLAVHTVLPQDGTPEWYVGSAGSEPTDMWICEPRAWVTLPDPINAGVAKLGSKRSSIHFETGDAKTIYIHPPWTEIPRIKCHLEYTSRWSFRFPSTHETKLSDSGDKLDLKWRFQDDPVSYSVHMHADRPDAVLVEVALTNDGQDPVEDFRPGFCLQIGGASSPKTFAYTIIPQIGKPFPLSGGHPFVARPELWPGIGWVRAHYRDSAAYSERKKLGAAYEPHRSLIAETGDFPLLARRMPGRDAWIAWLWPNAIEYFGNTQTPCMHMDPVLPECPAGETRRIFGRMVFFEGTWDELSRYAKREREELARRSGLE